MLELIKQYIHPGYREMARQDSGLLLLEETQPQATCRKVWLETERKALVYKFDKTVAHQQRRLPFMNPLPGVEQMCDFVVFLEEDPKTTFVVLCNLKSNKPGNNDSQMDAGELFIGFILDTLMRCEGINHHKFRWRKLLFMSRNLPRGLTKPTSRAANTTVTLPCARPINLDVYC